MDQKFRHVSLASSASGSYEVVFKTLDRAAVRLKDSLVRELSHKAVGRRS